MRVIFADASCSIVGNSGNSILNSFPIIASLLPLFEMYLISNSNLDNPNICDIRKSQDPCRFVNLKNITKSCVEWGGVRWT